MVCLGIGALISTLPQEDATQESNDSPALTFYHFKAYEYNQKGQVKRQITGSKIISFNDKNFSHIFNPVIYLLIKNHPFKITAKEALSYDDNQRILLKGKVKIVKKTIGKKNQSVILTERLWYYPKKQEIMTHAAISFKDDTMSIHSRGMRADLKKEKIELFNQARGQYNSSRS